MSKINTQQVKVAPSITKTVQPLANPTKVATPKASALAVKDAPFITKTVFSFKKRPAIAPKGLQNGVFVLAVNESKGEGDAEVNRFRVAIELEEADAKGPVFTVEKVYNILPNGRGINAFLEDYYEWSGEALTEDDLYDEFDCKAMIEGKQVVVEIDHRQKGKEWEAFIKSFHPEGYTGEVENQEAVMEEQPA